MKGASSLDDVRALQRTLQLYCRSTHYWTVYRAKLKVKTSKAKRSNHFLVRHSRRAIDFWQQLVRCVSLARKEDWYKILKSRQYTPSDFVYCWEKIQNAF